MATLTVLSAGAAGPLAGRGVSASDGRADVAVVLGAAVVEAAGDTGGGAATAVGATEGEPVLSRLPGCLWRLDANDRAGGADADRPEWRCLASVQFPDPPSALGQIQRGEHQIERAAADGELTLACQIQECFGGVAELADLAEIEKPRDALDGMEAAEYRN